MEELLKTELLKIINSKRNKTYPEWTNPVEVITQDTDCKVFDITDTKTIGGSMIVGQGEGQATYFNGCDVTAHVLRFISYERYVNQFRVFDGSELKDWAKGISRPDYMCYTVSDNDYFIIHELSEGSVGSKRSKARDQMVKCLLMMKQSEPMMHYLARFQHRFCFLSAKGCVEYDTKGMADGFTEIYRNIPDPLPLKCSTFERLNFEAFETNAIKLE